MELNICFHWLWYLLLNQYHWHRCCSVGLSDMIGSSGLLAAVLTFMSLLPLSLLSLLCLWCKRKSSECVFHGLGRYKCCACCSVKTERNDWVFYFIFKHILNCLSWINQKIRNCKSCNWACLQPEVNSFYSDFYNAVLWGKYHSAEEFVAAMPQLATGENWNTLAVSGF